jgi:hypothetical protein
MNQELHPYLEQIINFDGEKLFGNEEFYQELKIFKEVKKWAVEFNELNSAFDLTDYFSESDVKMIAQAFSTFNYHFIRSSDKQEKSKEDLLSFYEENKDEITIKKRNLLLFRKLENLDPEAYKTKLKQEAKTLADELKTEVNSLRAARATENLSTHFSDYAKKIGEEIEGKKKDSWWSKFQSIIQSIIFPIGIKGKIRVLRIFNYAIPVIFVAGVISFKEILEKQTLIELAIFFSVTMSLLFSHLKSATRDLNILKNSKESYEHRAKVAETFIAFLASESKDEITKSEMAKQAAIAMFQRVPSGYLTKDQIEPISHPLTEILLKQKITK